MIEIERSASSRNGQFGWKVRGRPEICGRSRQPLLDACRALKSIGEDPSREIGLFRPESTIWDLRTTVGYGAALTVAEGDRDIPRFRRFVPDPRYAD